MKANETSESPIAISRKSGAPAPAARSSNWRDLVWVTVLVAAALIVFERLKHFLFPHATSPEYQAMTVCVGTIAAVIGAYYSTRKLDRAVALHTQAENKLALERNVLRTVTDNIPDGIFAKDTQGRYLLANRSFAAIHGVGNPDELVGKTAFDLFPKERAEEHRRDDLKVMKSGGSIMETERTAVDADGNVKVLQTTKVPLIDKTDHVVGIVGLHRDVTKKKEAERRLTQSEANLAAAQRIAHVGSVELDLVNPADPEKNPVRWSDEVFRIFGYDKALQEPSRRAFFQLVHPDEKEDVQTTLDHALREAKPYAVDFRIERPDGTVRNIHERGDILFDPKTQKPLKLVGIVQDVTERVRAELQLQEANRNLGEKVEELERRSTEIQILSDMGSRLQSCKNNQEAFMAFAHAGDQLFPGWTGSLCVTSASRTSVEAVTEWGTPSAAERVFAPDDCWALRRGQPQSFRHGDKFAHCQHIDASKVSASLCIPLMAEAEAIGILSLQRLGGPNGTDSVPRADGESHRKLAAVFAEQIALALGNLKLRETLRNQSICDSLTGLSNRRFLEESLEREFSRAHRNRTTVAIVMIDLDHFKKFNDTFGHQAGDAVLRAFGDLLSRGTRGQDIACRYGGEEFALMLSDSSLAGALQRAEILRRQVKQLSVEYAGQLLGAVSVSIGVAIFPDHGSTIGDVIRSADQALYAAKREGRDRVAAWTAETVI